jgi:hypothetical protein
MRLSVGLLYTGKDILDVLSKYQISGETLYGMPYRSYVAPYREAINFSLKCGWLEVGDHSILRPSNRGQTILSESNYQEQLKLQIEDFIEVVQPIWSKLIPHGRAQAIGYMDADSRQCFRESGLMETPPSDAIVGWWDRLSARSRGRQKDILNDIGRTGERLSIDYENKRVGKPPKWQAIESNSDGYDIISSVSDTDDCRLTIEVKASVQSVEAATFHITRNEWEYAKNAGKHKFHIWSKVNTRPLFASLSISDLESHIPINKGQGSWELVEIAYIAFSKAFLECREVV